MKYYKYLEGYIKDSALKSGIIYPADFVDKGIYGESCLTVEFYVINSKYFNKTYKWEEVSEREYWQQELDAGKLVKGGYYVNSNQVIHKHSGTQDAEYYLNWKQNTFDRNRGSFDTIQENDFYRLATDDEIEWLEACNKADRFISKEEFMKSKEFILKENMKDRKVDYYKLTKPEVIKAAEVIMQVPFDYEESVGIVKVPDCIEKLEKAGVLDLWFEPVYEPELKVGDWITFNTGETVKITDISPDYYAGQWIKHEGQAFTGGGFRWGENGYFLGKDFRLATLEEIKKSTVIKIKGYEAKIDAQEGKVNIGCKSFTYGNVRGVVAAIKAGLKVEDADQILKLWDKIK